MRIEKREYLQLTLTSHYHLLTILIIIIIVLLLLLLILLLLLLLYCQGSLDSAGVLAHAPQRGWPVGISAGPGHYSAAYCPRWAGSRVSSSTRRWPTTGEEFHCQQWISRGKFWNANFPMITRILKKREWMMAICVHSPIDVCILSILARCNPYFSTHSPECTLDPVDLPVLPKRLVGKGIKTD